MVFRLLQKVIGMGVVVGLAVLCVYTSTTNFNEGSVKAQAKEIEEQKYIVRMGEIYNDVIITDDGNEWMLIDPPEYEMGQRVRVLYDSKETVAVEDDEIIDIIDWN